MQCAFNILIEVCGAWSEAKAPAAPAASESTAAAGEEPVVLKRVTVPVDAEKAPTHGAPEMGKEVPEAQDLETPPAVGETWYVRIRAFQNSSASELSWSRPSIRRMGRRRWAMQKAVLMMRTECLGRQCGTRFRYEMSRFLELVFVFPWDHAPSSFLLGRLDSFEGLIEAPCCFL